MIEYLETLEDLNPKRKIMKAKYYTSLNINEK